MSFCPRLPSWLLGLVLAVSAGWAADGSAALAPVLVPPPGSYQTVVPVVPHGRLNAGERLVYTLDGTAPSTAAWPCPELVLLTDTTTLRIGVINAQGVVVRQAGGAYTISAVLATTRPAAQPPGGTYAAPLVVALTCPTPGAIIRFTTNGSEPDCGSTRYTAPITLTQNTTVRARAFGGTVTVRIGRFTLTLPALFPSGVMAASYTLQGAAQQVATPVIAPADGLYHAVLQAQATNSTAGAVLRYRTDGADPTATDPAVPSGGVSIEQSRTLTVRGFLDGWTPSAVARAAYVLQPVAPTASLAAGAYVSGQSVTLACATPGVVLHYTLDGSTPTAASPVASGAIALPGSCTLATIATQTGWTDSPVFSAAYVLQVPAVTLSSAGGTFTAPVTVTATVPAGSTATYTLDGTDPTAASAAWPASGVTIAQGATLTVRAFRTGWSPSAPATISCSFQTAAVTATPPAGSFGTLQAVTLTTSTPAAAIRYTIDGSDPMSSATAQTASGPVTIDRNLTLQAIATRTGWLPSPAFTGVYVFQAAVPAASLAAGTYVGPQSVTLASGTPAAVIRYTLDGSAPTAASPIASGPINLPGSSTLTAVAMLDGWTISAPLTVDYMLQVPAVTLSSAGGTFTAPVTVTATVPAGSTATYTLDGTDPTAAGTAWPAAGLVIDQGATLTVRAFQTGWSPSAPTAITCAFQTAAITVDPPAGSFGAPQAVTLATTTPSAVLRYTLDGSDPASSATAQIVGGPITIDRSLTLRAIAARAGWLPSPVFTGAYAFQAAAPTASLAAGAYVGPQSVTLASGTPAAVIRYTVDGSAPTAASPVAAGPIDLLGSCTLTAIALREGWTDSAPLVVAYSLQVPTVTLSSSGGTFTAPANVTATVSPGATATYTLDGSDPTATSAPYPAVGLVVDQGATLIVRAFQAGWTPSAPTSITLAFQATAPTANPSAGTFTAVQTVALATPTPGATIRYTIDGSEPETSSTVQTATGPVSVDRNLTILARTVRAGWLTSPLLTSAYAFQVQAVAVTPAPGAFATGTLLTFACATSGAAIRATLDGSDPTTSGTAVTVTGPIALTADSTVRAIAIHDGWTASAPFQGTYTLTAPTLVAPTISAPPTDVTVTAPAPATFSVVATGTAPLTFQWERNEMPVANATAATYTLDATSVNDNGTQWRVVVTNAAGSTTSTSAMLIVETAPPAIIAQPERQVVAIGQTATFQVVATGHPAPTYQWQRNHAEISGATAASYTTPVLDASDSGAVFSVAVSNERGWTLSNSAELIVVAAVGPTITRQPLTWTFVPATASATLTVEATGDPPLTYQWKRSGLVIPRATEASYTTPPTTRADQGQPYTVTVTSGGISVTSSAAYLNVQPATGFNQAWYEVDPANSLGGSLQAVAYAANQDPAQISYTWTMLVGPAPVTFGAENGTVTGGTTNVTFSQVGTYLFRCTASVAGLQWSTTVQMSCDALVFNQPLLLLQPENSDGYWDQWMQQWYDFNTGTYMDPPNSITGTNVGMFSAQATTNGAGDDSAITYTWSTIYGPGAVQFSASGDNAAQTTQATFSADGVYGMCCTATYQSLSIPSYHEITVSSGLMTLNAYAWNYAYPNTWYGNTLSLIAEASNPAWETTYAWSVVSGPAVVFSDNQSTSGMTSATFAANGEYVLRCTATSNGFSASADVQVRVQVLWFTSNPTVSPADHLATPNWRTYANAASGIGSGTVTYTWSQLAGPGTVTFADSHRNNTTLTVSKPGYYILRCTATSGAIAISADAWIDASAVKFVQSVAIQQPNPTILSATVSTLADAWGGEAGISYAWTASGPGEVAFATNGTNAAKATTATFSALGHYSIICTATANGASATRSNSIALTGIAITQTPRATFSNAAMPLEGTLSARANSWQGETAVSYTWSLLNGPGTVTFSENGTNAAKDTQATFSTPGRYLFYCAMTVGTQYVGAYCSAYCNPMYFSQQPTVVTTPMHEKTGQLRALAYSWQGESTVTYTWSVVNGPGTVDFAPNGTNTAKQTTATFSQPGYYTLRCTAASGGVTIAANTWANNESVRWVQPPTPLENQSVGPSVALYAQATGWLPASQITYHWSAAGDDPLVTFSTNDSNAAQYTDVSRQGSWDFPPITCTATCGDMTISATASMPAPPLQFMTYPIIRWTGGGFLARADASAWYEGAVITYTWSQISGPAEATFTSIEFDGAGDASEVTMPLAGDYEFACRAMCDDLYIDGTTTFRVYDPVTPTLRLSYLDVGHRSLGVGLAGTVRAIGQSPRGDNQIIYTWEKLSGPGTAQFMPNGSNAAGAAQVMCSETGQYIFRLTVTDGAETLVFDRAVTVAIVQPLAGIASYLAAEPGRAINQAQWASDEAYRQRVLSQITPARLWQTAGSGGVALHLTDAGSVRRTAIVGQPLRIDITGAPGAPLTIASLDKRLLCQNGQLTMTQACAEDGQATVVITVGQAAEGDILLTSPQSPNILRIHVVAAGATP